MKTDTRPSEVPENYIPGSNRGALDARHAEYAAAPSETRLSELLLEVNRYAQRTLLKSGYARRLDLSEAAQIATIKVWLNLKRFHGQSKFSAWAHRIIENAARDEIRRTERLRESKLPDNDVLSGDQSRCFKGVSGESADGDFRVSGSRTPLPAGLGPDLHDDEESDRSLYEEQAAALDRLMEGLSTEDFVILHFVRQGFKPTHIAKVINKTPRWVSDRLFKIKSRLRRAAAIFEESRRLSIAGEKIPSPSSQGGHPKNIVHH